MSKDTEKDQESSLDMEEEQHIQYKSFKKDPYYVHRRMVQAWSLHKSNWRIITMLNGKKQYD